jgi:hypothetical protein
MSAPAETAVSGFMPAKVATRTLPFKSRTRLSAFERLGQKWGCKGETAKDRVYGERGIYQMVADANEAFLRDGHAERVAFLMAPVDASMMGEGVPHLHDAIHGHNTADAFEDAAQAEFIHSAGDGELEGWIRKLATDLHAGEVLLAALIRERDERRAK